MFPITLPGHYQPVFATNTEAFNFEDTLDIQTMLYILYQQHGMLKREKGYLIASDEIASEWASVELLKSFHLFPTIAANHYGAIVNFKGKTFHIYYEDHDALIIGHGTTLHQFKNEQGIDDCLTVYDFIFTDIKNWLDYAVNDQDKK